MDLIKLDTSIELEDFDPLNQNAKPIPSPPMRINGRSSASSGGGGELPAVVSLGYNNPLYPYFEPTGNNARTSVASSSGAGSATSGGGAAGGGGGIEDDLELLRNYGLDRLLVSSEGPRRAATMGRATKTTNNTISGTGSMTASDAGRSNWTTFE